MKKIIYLSALVFWVLCCSYEAKAAFVVERWGKVYIEDQTGELWEIDQAKSIGFNPVDFQYGIGRHAIKPLNNSHLKQKLKSAFENPRVLGVTEGDEAQAYLVKKLKKHEIANTSIGEKAIAAAY